MDLLFFNLRIRVKGPGRLVRAFVLSGVSIQCCFIHSIEGTQMEKGVSGRCLIALIF